MIYDKKMKTGPGGAMNNLDTVFYKVVPDIRPFLVSGIRPDIRFHLPDIRPVKLLN